MDSGNTAGSLPSSEDECDSRAAALQDSGSFITNHYQQSPPLNHQQHQINNSFFFSPSSQHHLLNLEAKTLPSFSDHHLFASPSQPSAGHTFPFSPMKTTEPISLTNPPPPVSNPKKRRRASRRAPTTVLTTDTNNFRAMVQEFTGIPAPPFTSPSPAFPNLTTSFDLFGRPSTSTMMRSNTNNFDNLLQLPPYLLHQFPQKLQSSSFLDSSNLLNTMQNPTITFPSNSLNQPQNVVSSNEIGLIGKTQILDNHATLPHLVSTALTATTTLHRINDDQAAFGDQGCDGNLKKLSGMKDD